MCHTWARAAAAAGQGVPFHEFCSLARVCTELLEQQTGQGGGHLQTRGWGPACLSPGDSAYGDLTLRSWVTCTAPAFTQVEQVPLIVAWLFGLFHHEQSRRPPSPALKKFASERMRR